MVVKVWGKADRFELVFSNLGNDNWTAIVPVDLEDGQYALELYCEDDGGNRAYWTGILYLSKSENATVYIVADKFKLWLVSEKMPETQEEAKTLWVIDETVPELQIEPEVWLQDDNIVLEFSCISHVGRG